MVNGQLSEATTIVIVGVLGLLGIAGLVFGVLIQIKKLRSDAKAETDAKVKKATEEAIREKESEIAFRELKASVDNVNTTVKKLTEDMNKRIEGVECTRTAHVAELAEIREIAKSAHKRIDEHRKIDHKIIEQDKESDYG
jgi:hypothetical protein